MGIVLRQGLKGIIATYIGIVIGAFNILWLFPKFLSSEEIGLTRVLIDVALLMAGLSQFGAPSIIDKYFPFFKDDEKKHNGFFILLIVYPLIGFLIMSVVFLSLKHFWIEAYQARSPMLLEYFYYIIPFAFFILYVNVLEAYCRIHFRIVVPIFIREVFLRIFLTVIVVLYHFKIINIDQLIVLLIVSYFCSVFLLLIYIKNLNKLFLFPQGVLSNKSLLKQMWFFGLFIFLGGAWGLIGSKIDVLMLGSMVNLGSTGVYSIAFFIGTVIEIPRRAISQISTPLISQAWKNNDLDAIHQLYSKTSLNLMVVGLLLFLLVWCNVDTILSLIPHAEEYRAGKYVILYIALCRLTDMATGVNSEIILNSSFYKFNFILIVFSAIILVLLNYLLIPAYGINGAALSVLFSYLLTNAIKFIFILIKFKMQPYNAKSLFILFIGLIAFFLAYFTPEIKIGFLSPFVNIFIRSMVIIIAFMTPVLYFRVSEDLDNLLKVLLKRLKLMKGRFVEIKTNTKLPTLFFINFALRNLFYLKICLII